MKLFVNSKETELTADAHIRELANQLQLPEQRIALAVNNKMIPRSEWDGYTLHEGDHVTIIKAACGG